MSIPWKEKEKQMLAAIVYPYILEGFDPEHFAPQKADKRNPHCDIPFGLGQRLCIGNQFTLMEAQIALAMIVQTFYLSIPLN